MQGNDIAQVNLHNSVNCLIHSKLIGSTFPAYAGKLLLSPMKIKARHCFLEYKCKDVSCKATPERGTIERETKLHM